MMNEIVVLTNPRKHKKAKYHRRRNPIAGVSLASAINTVKDGALGAAGALAADVAYGYGKGFLPSMLQAGYGRTGVKLALAIAMGVVTDKIFRGRGKAVAVGAATVTLHEALKELANSAAPSLPIGAYEDNAMLGYDSAQTVGSYMQTGAYMNRPAAARAMGDLLPQ